MAKSCLHLLDSQLAQSFQGGTGLLALLAAVSQMVLTVTLRLSVGFSKATQ
jgi:hypothetical protein